MADEKAPRAEREKMVDESVERNAELLDELARSEKAEKVPGPTAYDVVPPELRPHRW